MRAQWTDKALLRLRQIHQRIAQDQPLNAARFVDRLTRRAQAIAENPRSGQMVDKYQRDDIREIHEGRYRIVYRIRPDRIEILTVRHTARLMPRQMGDL